MDTTAATKAIERYEEATALYQAARMDAERFRVEAIRRKREAAAVLVGMGGPVVEVNGYAYEATPDGLDVFSFPGGGSFADEILAAVARTDRGILAEAGR